MRRRIFIAINLPENVKNKIVELQREFLDLPVRITKKNSLHLTLLFIGYVADEEMLKICQEIKEVAKKHEPFQLVFGRLCYGPSQGAPRLIWLEGKRNEKLFGLKIGIDNSLLVREQDPRFFAEAEKKSKGFISHITIARIRQMEWKKLPKKPVIDKELNISVPVNSIEVMESDLKKNGAEYIILESVQLGEATS